MSTESIVTATPATPPAEISLAAVTTAQPEVTKSVTPPAEAPKTETTTTTAAPATATPETPDVNSLLADFKKQFATEMEGLQTTKKALDDQLASVAAQKENAEKSEIIKNSGKVNPLAVEDFRAAFPNAKTPEEIETALTQKPWLRNQTVPGIDAGGKQKADTPPPLPGEIDYAKTKNPDWIKKVFKIK